MRGGAGQAIGRAASAPAARAQVATRRTRTAGKVEIPNVDDHVSKLEHMGKETVKKLQDIRGSAVQCGIEVSVPDNCIVKGARTPPAGPHPKPILCRRPLPGLRSAAASSAGPGALLTRGAVTCWRAGRPETESIRHGRDGACDRRYPGTGVLHTECPQSSAPAGALTRQVLTVLIGAQTCLV